MDILVGIISVFLLSFTVYKASEVFVHSVKSLAKDGFLSKFLLASIFGGIATSIPEVFIGITSSIERKPEIAVGNALGSNIADLALILPLVILVSGRVISIDKEEIGVKHSFLIFTSSFAPFLLAVDGVISRVDGLFLLGMFFIYTFYIFQKRPSGVFSLFSFLRKVSHKLHKKDTKNSLLALVFSILILLLASDFLVKTALFLSLRLNIRVFLLSMFLIAVGTSLPEFFVALQALRKNDVSILFGDIFGSLVTNANLVVGIAGVVSPIVFANLYFYTLSIIVLFLSFILFAIFSFTKSKIEHWEALVLLFLYIIFFIFEGTI